MAMMNSPAPALDPNMAAAGAASAAAPPVPDDAGAMDDDAGQQGQVLCTVMDNGDGTYTLMQGDEDDADAGGEAGGLDAGDATGGGAPAAGSPGGALPDVLGSGDGASGAGASEGQTFNSVGELLKGILDLINQKSGEGSDDENFDAGYNDDAAPAPNKSAAGASAIGSKF